MTIEAKIEALTAAIVALTAALGNRTPTVAAAPVAAPVPAPVAALGSHINFDAPVAAPVAPVAAPVAAMPAPPTFVAPPPAAPAGAPFSDAKGLMDYVMSSYKALGPQKGAQIQGVLGSIGASTINEVRPEQYAALFAGVEALKV
jgi:hypothetical protein